MSAEKPPVPKYQKRRPSGPSLPPSGAGGGRRLSGTGLTNVGRMNLHRPSIQTIASVGSLEDQDAADYANFHAKGRSRQSRGSIWDRPRTKSMPRLSIYSLGAIEQEEFDEFDEEQEQEDLKCGYWGWKPDFLQVFNTPGFLLAALAFFNAGQGFMINGTLNQVTSTLERRFDLSSLQVSFINTSYDIFYGFFVLPLGFMAQFKYKPRILACGALFVATGGIVFTLPHLLVGEYELGTMEWDYTCRRGDDTEDPLCANSENAALYMAVFCLAQLLNSAGGVTLQVVAIPMLDENIKSKQLPLYQGINMATNMIGPAMSATIGSRFLNIYVDIGRVDLDDVVLEPTDPAWVGAWWMSFLLASFMLCCASSILFLFSYETPAARRNAKFRFQEAHGGRGLRETRNENFGARIREIPYSMKLLLTNPVVLVATIVAILEVGTVSGLNMFLAKFIQFQFRQTPASASMFLGATLLPGALTGLVAGGYIAKRWELKIPGLMKMNIVSGCCAIPLALILLMKCEKLPLAGIYAPYANDTETLGSMNHPCNEGCGCSLREYKPSCGVDNKIYFSPCHAGCTEENLFHPDDPEQYFHCSCLVGYENPAWNVGQVELGVCDTGCVELYIFLAGFFFLIVAQFFGGSTGLSALLRSVPEKERTMAVAVQQLFTRYLGMVPFPFLLAAIFDSACEVFQYKCGEKGACWVYDSDFLAIGLTIWVVTIKVISTSMYLLGIKFYRPPPKEVADPTNVASNEEIMSIYSRSGSIASVVLDPPQGQHMSRMDTIGEDEEEEYSTDDESDIKKHKPTNGVSAVNGVLPAKAGAKPMNYSSSSSSSSSSDSDSDREAGHVNRAFSPDELPRKDSIDSSSSDDDSGVQGHTFGGPHLKDSNTISTSL